MSHAPEDLARHYTRFRVSERLLLTGHSHQAWPDVAFEAQQRAWLDAAELVDEKWQRAYQVAELVREGWARLLGPDARTIALGQNTHEMVTRFLSALPLRKRPRLITTDAEFHTLRRQLDRLAEEGIEVVKVPGQPVATVSERLAAAVDDRAAAVLFSSVYYETAEVVPHLHAVAASCRRHGCELLVDAYHHLNVVPFDLAALGLEEAFVTGGGYKYCQMGEGNAFLRVPDGREHMRPVLTGWFSEFGKLESAAPREPVAAGSPTGGPAARVAYGAGAARWAGATYDPTAHYRAELVFAFFRSMKLTPLRLREISQHQMALMAARCRQAPLAGRVRAVGVEAAGLDGVGGFLALEVKDAAEVMRRLRERGVLCDHRGSILRLGPAPYLTDAQLEDAMTRLWEAAGAK
jgi:kynureninase